MGRKDNSDDADWTGGSVGGRPGREHPNGWGNARDRTDADSTDPAVSNRDPIYGWGKDGVEGLR